MGSVGGSRHYTGGGLGSEAGWKCPNCGAVNLGAISHGCELCGSGKPGHRAVDPPPKPPPPTRARHEPEPEPEPELEQPQADEDVAGRWAHDHPEASLTDAFRAGYRLGIQQALAARPRPSPHGKVNRTIAAALALFRDQILSSHPEEVASGEWMSADEVSALIDQLLEPADA
jgi:hypothetical protein